MIFRMRRCSLIVLTVLLCAACSAVRSAPEATPQPLPSLTPPSVPIASPAVIITATPAPDAAQTATDWAQFQVTLSALKTEVAVQQWPTPAFVGTPFDTARIQHQCLGVSPTVDSLGKSLKGTVALVSNRYRSKDSYLLNLQTGQKKAIFTEGRTYIDQFSASPAGQWIAYLATCLATRDSLLIISTVDGHNLREIPMDAELAPNDPGIITWLDDERLVIGSGNEDFKDPYTLILNPVTRQSRTFPSNYPDIYPLFYPQWYWGRYNLTRAVFRPDLTQVVYPSYDGVVLWDLQHAKPVRIFKEAPILFNSTPVWSPDGNVFVIALSSTNPAPDKYQDLNIYRVYPDGTADQLTFFSNADDGAYTGFMWSSDGKQIAFWLLTGWDEQKNGIYHLAVLDLATHEIIDYCIPGYNYRRTTPEGPPVWSPDGRFLAVAASWDQAVEDNQTVVVDLMNEKAYQIAENVIPAGWIAGP